MTRRKFCFNDYDIIGFDLDCTLARYKNYPLMRYLYNSMLEFMIQERDYSPVLSQYTWEEGHPFVQRGIFLDSTKGNFVKLNRYGSIIRASHGREFMTDKEIEVAYGPSRTATIFQEYIKTNREVTGRLYCFHDVFILPAMLLCANAITHSDSIYGKQEEYSTWTDVFSALMNLYRRDGLLTQSGAFFRAILGETHLHVNALSPRFKEWLLSLKRNGKVLYLCTGSNVEYCSFLSNFILGKDWKNYFHITICHAGKPGFFYGNRPFLGSGASDGREVSNPLTDLKVGGVYSNGNWRELEQWMTNRFLPNLSRQPNCMYLGDNIVLDVLGARQSMGVMNDAIAVIDDLDSRTPASEWGSFFEPSNLWTYLLRRFCLITIPAVEDLATVSLNYSFTPFSENHHGYFPHMPPEVPVVAPSAVTATVRKPIAVSGASVKMMGRGSRGLSSGQEQRKAKARNREGHITAWPLSLTADLSIDPIVSDEEFDRPSELFRNISGGSVSLADVTDQLRPGDLDSLPGESVAQVYIATAAASADATSSATSCGGVELSGLAKPEMTPAPVPMCNVAEESAQVRSLNLLEYQSKVLLNDHNVNVQRFKMAERDEDADRIAKEFVVDEFVMVAESVDIKRETYVCLLLDRDSDGPILIASPDGGADIEELAKTSPEKIHKYKIDVLEGITDKQADDVAEFLQFQGHLKKEAASQIKALWRLFCSVDAVQLEVNPLAETTDNQVISVDAKIVFDDNSAYRQRDIFDQEDLAEKDPREVVASKHNLNYIAMDGNIGCLVNGAGLAMATMDIIKLHGGEPANFLDVGGGVNQAQVLEAFKLLTSGAYPISSRHASTCSLDENVKAILVNVFGGIVNCGTIAEGIVGACRNIDLNVPLIVRLEGTNVDEARRILSESGLPIVAATDLKDAAQKAVESLA
ncbi:unnamed protein product [Cyprideis torosa]|uniref:Succinyl-CoA synthetase beta chain n=1 Tax=Cyprideis torosa TaxID=163714 RepID=A0A7R8WJN7_9CRUS|nr:unnamed protein product [Cyprideis torosa]CAG0895950.1 unnamed protein product [Cyprideis torosa]